MSELKKEHWLADLSLLTEQLRGHYELGDHESDNPHDVFASKLYLISATEIDKLQARIKELEGALGNIAEWHDSEGDELAKYAERTLKGEN